MEATVGFSISERSRNILPSEVESHVSGGGKD